MAVSPAVAPLDRCRCREATTHAARTIAHRRPTAFCSKCTLARVNSFCQRPNHHRIDSPRIAMSDDPERGSLLCPRAGFRGARSALRPTRVGCGDCRSWLGFVCELVVRDARPRKPRAPAGKAGSVAMKPPAVVVDRLRPLALLHRLRVRQRRLVHCGRLPLRSGVPGRDPAVEIARLGVARAGRRTRRWLRRRWRPGASARARRLGPGGTARRGSRLSALRPALVGGSPERESGARLIAGGSGHGGRRRWLARLSNVVILVSVDDSAHRLRGLVGIGARRAQALATVTRMGRDRLRARVGEAD